MTVRALEIADEAHAHVVTFYERDDALCRTVAEYLADAIEQGGAGIAIATVAHRRAIRAELRAAEIDVTAAVRGGTLVLCDAADTMARFIHGGRIDGDAFRRVIGATLRGAADAGTPVRAYGEMVALLWDAGDVLSAIELEEQWNAVAAEHDFSLLCGYRSASIAGPEHEQALRHVCALHTSVLDPTARDASEASGWFPPNEDTPRAARRLVTDALGGWGFDGAAVDEARVVVSELATNAIIHARSGCSVAVRRTDSGIRISVGDLSPAQPTVRDEPARMSGRGLPIVAALASAWGVEPRPDGKTVWAELRA